MPESRPIQHRTLGRDLPERAALAQEIIQLCPRLSVSLEADGREITSYDLAKLSLGLLQTLRDYLNARDQFGC